MGKNWEWSKVKGKEKRLEAELNAHKNHVAVPSSPPFFSHCGTMQSYFNKGWYSVTAIDIRIHLTPSSAPSGANQKAKLRSLKQCHSL